MRYPCTARPADVLEVFQLEPSSVLQIRTISLDGHGVGSGPDKLAPHVYMKLAGARALRAQLDAFITAQEATGRG
jgi:hypothetical protein